MTCISFIEGHLLENSQEGNYCIIQLTSAAAGAKKKTRNDYKSTIWFVLSNKLIKATLHFNVVLLPALLHLFFQLLWRSKTTQSVLIKTDHTQTCLTWFLEAVKRSMDVLSSGHPSEEPLEARPRLAEQDLSGRLRVLRRSSEATLVRQMGFFRDKPVAGA